MRHAWRPLGGLKSHQAGGISLGTDSDAEHCAGRCKMPNTPRFRPPGWVCETHLGAFGRAQKPTRPGGLASAMTVRALRCERLNTARFRPPGGVCETHLGVLQEAQNPSGPGGFAFEMRLEKGVQWHTPPPSPPLRSFWGPPGGVGRGEHYTKTTVESHAR